jgi:phage-related baseplate assembly protein
MASDVSPLPAFAGLPPLAFALKDPTLIVTNIIAAVEAFYLQNTGKAISLAEADPRRLFELVNAALVTQQRVLIDFANKQNLVAFSQAPFLDALAGNWGYDHNGNLIGLRKAATAAQTTLQFTLPAPLGTVITVPASTQVGAPSGSIFLTDTDANIPIGSTSIIVSSSCSVPGTIGNGFVPGQVNQPVNWPENLLNNNVSAVNIDTSVGGFDTESDYDFANRQLLIPDGFGSAGAIGPYKRAIAGTKTAILDSAVIGPQSIQLLPPNYNGGPPFPSGTVNIYVLEQGPAMPNASTLADVQAACEDDWTRPATDYVFCQSPSGVPFSISVQWDCDIDNLPNQTNIAAAMVNTANSYAIWQQSKIGRSLNPAYATQQFMATGASFVRVVSPAYQDLQPYQVPVLSATSGVPNISVVYLGPVSDLTN